MSAEREGDVAGGRGEGSSAGLCVWPLPRRVMRQRILGAAGGRGDPDGPPTPPRLTSLDSEHAGQGAGCFHPCPTTRMCVCMRVCACVRVCVCECVCECVGACV